MFCVESINAETILRFGASSLIDVSQLLRDLIDSDDIQGQLVRPSIKDFIRLR